MFFFHQRHFHLVLNVLHVHAVAEVQMTHDALECFGVELIARSRTGLHDGIFDLIDAEWFFGTVALRDDEIFGAHCFLVCLMRYIELTRRVKEKETSLCWGRGSDRVVVQLSFVPRI